jgi:hypothetical protein
MGKIRNGRRLLTAPASSSTLKGPTERKRNRQLAVWI